MRLTPKALLVATGAILAGAAVAQPSQPERPAQQVQRDLSTTGQAAAAAREQTGQGGAKITFDQILRNPDDIDLNFRYAQQKVQEGDLKSASTTLERILLVRPDLTQIRLLFAIVLFRLDNMQEAEREFRTLSTDRAPDVRAEANRYLEQIKLRNKDTKYSASIGIGLDYNSNRDAYPRSENRLVRDALGSAAPGGNADMAQIVLGTLAIRHDLGTQERHELLFNATGYLANQAEVDTQDLSALALETGGVLRLPWFDLTPTVTYTRVSLDHQHFLDAYGFKLRGEKKLASWVDFYSQAWAQYQNFASITSAASAPERSGPRYDFEIGFNFNIAPTERIGVGWIHTRKYGAGADDAGSRFDTQDYVGNELAVNHTWLLGRGQFILNNFSIGRDIYEQNDPLISGLTRHDLNLRYRTTYGAPLETIFGWAGIQLAPEIADITFTAGLELFRSYSNITNFEYDNVKFQTLLTKRFDW